MDSQLVSGVYGYLKSIVTFFRYIHRSNSLSMDTFSENPNNFKNSRTSSAVKKGKRFDTDHILSKSLGISLKLFRHTI